MHERFALYCFIIRFIVNPTLKQRACIAHIDISIIILLGLTIKESENGYISPPLIHIVVSTVHLIHLHVFKMHVQYI